MQRPIRREQDFNQFLRILRRKERPTHLPFYEHLASPGFIARRTETRFDEMSMNDPDYWRIYVDFWMGLGYDEVPMEIPPDFPVPEGGHGLTEGSEAFVVIRTLEDCERYPWPSEKTPIEFRHFEAVAKHLPPGIKIVGGVCAGPYEWASKLMGTIGMAYALADQPELVARVFEHIGRIHVSGVRQLAQMDAVGALRQGDDLGFKSSTFLSPEQLREYVFPIYRRMADAAHAAGKPFILHSCGNLADVYDDLIETCQIDAKHSFEDVILPVNEFKKRYGTRVTPLGGLDVDTICRSTETEVRAYARRMIEACWTDGFWALGTGNSLTNYMPVENYVAVLEEGLKVAG